MTTISPDNESDSDADVVFDDTDLNIPSYVVDPFYRYKMPRPIIDWTTQNSKTYTKIYNFTEIAKALRRQPFYLSCFFEAHFTTKTCIKCTLCQLTGKYQCDDIVNAIDRFVESFMMCESCKSIETTSQFTHTHTVLSCNACGHTTRCIIDKQYTTMANHIQSIEAKQKCAAKTNPQATKSAEFPAVGKAKHTTKKKSTHSNTNANADALTSPVHIKFQDLDELLVDPVDFSMKQAIVLTDDEVDRLAEQGTTTLQSPLGSLASSELALSEKYADSLLLHKERANLAANLAKSKLLSFDLEEFASSEEEETVLYVPKARKVLDTQSIIASKFFDFEDF